MDINVIGGGPGGLYASLLLKKAHPSWEITVYERDPADNTYGWGIVFSDSTLGTLRDADYPTHERITDEFAHWDPIDIHYRGEYVRCGGHSFAGLMRADLKDILRERCAELGVEMHWEHTVETPAEYAEDADLLIGADGLNSVTRDAYAEHFQPQVRMGETKFAWFGTEKPFDVFTFIFREDDHGLWRIHAYPGRMSTFIVECTEDTWRSAGLDEMDEAAGLGFIEDRFDDHLAGYSLESKLYEWRHFPIVSNKTWSHDNVVLLGDAAHTAHFSVGAGTKMAMEDAIALYEGFEEYGADNVAGAVNRYQMDRQPRVEAIQDASRNSRLYFENTERYTDLPPDQFAFNLLTRSGRISYDELKIRDAEYVDEFDRWYEQYARDRSDRFAVSTPPMFQPFDLREVRLRNRAVFAPNPSSVGSSATPAPEQTGRLVDCATTGAGLAVTEPLAVSERGRISPGTPGLYEDEHEQRWATAVTDARSHAGTALGVSLLHAGQRAATEPRDRGLDQPLSPGDSWEPVSASATRYTPRSQRARSLSPEGLDRVKREFVAATERADRTGFDLLELDMSHGYLLSSFLSPLTNDRDDAYGGDLDGRLAYPVEVLGAVRDAWPDDNPIAVKYSVTDWHPEGNDLDAAFEIGARLADAGCDLLTVVAGQTVSNDRPRFDTDLLARYSEQLNNELGVATMSTNYVTSTDALNTQVGGATADLCHWHPSGDGINPL